jgi:hypothetical protein
MNWEDAKATCLRRADLATEEELKLVARTRIDDGPAPAYVVTSRFDLAMIDLSSPSGATVRVRTIARLEVAEILHDHDVPVVSMDERGQTFLERELHLSAGPRPRLTAQTKLIVGERVAWNDVRWFLVEYLADGDGCVA